MPSWWRHVNKRVFNPRALLTGRWSVIHHVGRKTGAQYRTPLEAMPVDDGYVFTLVYGSHSDWVQNILSAGSATLDVGGGEVDLVDPELLTADEAFARLPPGTKRPPRILRIDEFLAMRKASA